MSGMQFTNGRIFVPFSKIDRENRTVWGIAQAEDPDCQDDLIDYAASVRAFEAWPKNIREMHNTHRAIGKCVDIVCDPKTKQIAVGARISKGAEDAWQKVLDGTYRGYSIGGYPVRTGTVTKNGRRLRHITEYVLEELSLVDTPANPRCVITAITKRGSNLVATNLLGAVRPKGTPMRTRAKVPALLSFTKSLGANDELVVVRQSDFIKGADGNYYVKRDATMAPFKKADLDADGYDDSSDDAAPDSGVKGVSDQDMGEHAQNALDAHDDWHKMAGHDECNCDRDDDAPEMKGPGGDEDPGADPSDDMGKNASRRRRRNALRKRQRAALGISKVDVEALLASFAKGLDDKLDALRTGGDAAPRKGADGVLVKRDDTTNDADGNPTDPLAKNHASLKDAYAKREAYLKKGTQGLSPQDRSEREALAHEIHALEVEQLTLTGSQAR